MSGSPELGTLGEGVRRMISVIIPAYNAEETLEACLAALGSQSVDAGEYEIVVVDDGSRDRTSEIAERYGVRLVRQPNAGPAAARNRGAQVARGEILLFTDADCEPTSDWVAQMIAPFQDAEVAGCKGIYRTRQRDWVARFVQLEYEYKYVRLARYAQIDFIDTYSAAYRRHVFLSNDGFDTVFSTASVEDQEFSFRLASKGYRLVFSPQAAVYHIHDRTAGEYARRKYGIGYWKALLLRRHPRRAVRDSHTPQTLKAQIALAGLLCPLVIAAIFWPPVGWLVLGVVGLFLAAAFPFQVHIARRDPPLLLIALWLLGVRAVALGVGLIAGTIRFSGLAKAGGNGRTFGA